MADVLGNCVWCTSVRPPGGLEQMNCNAVRRTPQGSRWDHRNSGPITPVHRPTIPMLVLRHHAIQGRDSGAVEASAKDLHEQDPSVDNSENDGEGRGRDQPVETAAAACEQGCPGDTQAHRDCRGWNDATDQPGFAGFIL
jgi:hypothetical protein